MIDCGLLMVNDEDVRKSILNHGCGPTLEKEVKEMQFGKIRE